MRKKTSDLYKKAGSLIAISEDDIRGMWLDGVFRQPGYPDAYGYALGHPFFERARLYHLLKANRGAMNGLLWR
ncbi:hypothetical protein IVB02_03280 [Bradyrhizobium sp. 166]|uniref:hypothetical protein n=1 Tax=Bradyrhizobium sp. 166 TaxID=2782638 RepID=UPI001FF8557F|nr:hypothetical protein [Bradyrhizobium sp. 166]MCK1600469.1 hypothetical protein [Bradyrhizobium sp. 166]